MVPVIAGRTYRVSAEMRLTGATTLGVDQAHLQHMMLNADYSVNSATEVSPALDLTASWATYSFDWTALIGAAAWLRLRAYKRSAYTDPTGVIEMRGFALVPRVASAPVLAAPIWKPGPTS